MEENPQYRNMTLSLKVTAAQKAEYIKIASKYDISISEWLSSVIEMNKHSFGNVGEPSKTEKKQQELIDKQKKEIQRLENKLVIANELKGVELVSNQELREHISDWKVYGKNVKNRLALLEEENKQLKESLEKTHKKIDAFADDQDGYGFLSMFNAIEIRNLKVEA